MLTAEQTIHLAMQYLASAAHSFSDPQSDQSHIDLGWNESESCLYSGPLNDEGLRLELNLQVYALDVVHPESGLSGSFPLTGARHFDLLNWLDNERQFCGIQKPYSYDLPYSIPVMEHISESFHFASLNGSSLDPIISHFQSAYQALNALGLEEKPVFSPQNARPLIRRAGAIIETSGDSDIKYTSGSTVKVWPASSVVDALMKLSE
jgi:hypothetical protein